MKELARADVNVTALLNKERQEESKTFLMLLARRIWKRTLMIPGGRF